MKNVSMLFVSKIVVVVAVIGIVVAEFPSLAQRPFVVGYIVHNRAERSLNIQLSSDNKSWQNSSLDPDQVRVFPCDTCRFARVVTNTDEGKRTVDYEMECGKRYSLEYNNKKGCWDFFKANE